MCWIGVLVGAYVGSRLGLGPVGSLIFSLIGGYIETRIRARRRMASRHGARRPAGAASTHDPELAAAYRTIGISPGASWAEVKKAYRARAKACHPDVLRARGASEREIAEATEAMMRINAAWERLKGSRGGMA